MPDLIEVPKPLEHASVVGDHINFHLINPTPEENVAFQVKVMKRKVVCPTRVFFSSCRKTLEAWRAIYPDGWNVAAMWGCCCLIPDRCGVSAWCCLCPNPACFVYV